MTPLWAGTETLDVIFTVPYKIILTHNIQRLPYVALKAEIDGLLSIAEIYKEWHYIILLLAYLSRVDYIM